MATNLDKFKRELTLDVVSSMIDGDCNYCPVPEKFCNCNRCGCSDTIQKWMGMDENVFDIQTMGARVLSEMNNYILNAVGDESITERWLTCGVPDCADEDELFDLAKDSLSAGSDFREIVKLFNKLVNCE